MKIGSESELDKSYGRGAESKPANIVGGKLQIFLKISKGVKKPDCNTILNILDQFFP